MPDVLSSFSVLLVLLTSSRTLMPSLSLLSSALCLQQKVKPLPAPTEQELTLIRSPLFLDLISLLLPRPLRSLPCRFLSFCIPLPTPLSPFQTLTPTLSTHRCNGADFEEIKWSEKKQKKENVGMHMHSLSLSLDLTSLRNLIYSPLF